MKQITLTNILFIVVAIYSVAQTSNDTVYADFGVKIKLFNELLSPSTVLDSVEIQSFIDMPLKLVPLRSKGFYSLSFYSLPDQVLWSAERQNGVVEIMRTSIQDPVQAVAIDERNGHAYAITWDMADSDKSSIINDHTKCGTRKRKRLAKCIFVESIEIAELLSEN